jgi:hypothetical protein
MLNMALSHDASVERGMSKRVWLSLGLLLCALAAPARMYQWVDPDSRTTHLSGKPPAWYRLDPGAPRVFVFDGGQLIDDTARTLDPELARTLRREAFALAAAPAAAAPPLDDALYRAALRGAEAGNRVRPAAPPGGTGDRQPVPETQSSPPAEPVQTDAAEQADPATMVAKLRAMIDAWDRQQSDRAREVLESAR